MYYSLIDFVYTKNMSKAIKDLVPLILRDQDNWKITLLRNWPTIFGPLSERVSLERIQDDTLILGVQDSCWLQELYLLSAMLLKTINQQFDTPRIKQLRFKTVGNKKTASPPKQTKKIWPTKVVTLNPKETHALKNIKDEQLAAALKNFLIRCYQER